MSLPWNSKGKLRWLVEQNDAMFYVPYMDMMYRRFPVDWCIERRDSPSKHCAAASQNRPQMVGFRHFFVIFTPTSSSKVSFHGKYTLDRRFARLRRDSLDFDGLEYTFISKSKILSKIVVWGDAAPCLNWTLGNLKFYSEFKHFHSRKCIWKCHLRNVVYFVSVLMC